MQSISCSLQKRVEHPKAQPFERNVKGVKLLSNYLKFLLCGTTVILVLCSFGKNNWWKNAAAFVMKLCLSRTCGSVKTSRK